MDDNTGSFFIYKDTRKIYLRAIARENICTIPQEIFTTTRVLCKLIEIL